MKAMILAAGEGTRLRPLTQALPKPLIPIVGVPLLARTLRWLAGQGVTEAAINLYHRPQSIPQTLGQSFAGMRLHYFFEDTLRGTAGGLKAAASLFRDGPFYVIYGDNLIHADLRLLLAFHQGRGGTATLAMFHHPTPSAAGIISTNAQGRITRFVEKPPLDQIFSDTANAGVYLLNPPVLAAIPDNSPSDFGQDIFPRLLAQGVPLYGALLGGYLQDTGTPDAYRQANWDVMAGKTSEVFDDPFLWRGADVQIGAGVRLQGRNILGSGSRLGENASLTDCILWDNARIGANVTLERVILADNAAIAPNASVPPGTLLGEGEHWR
ncbi:MAG: NDP-sugar synthase [Armatimonadota bacterium]|nr:NDP-sugar synthase [Armatimonadota bacterium]